MKSMVVFCCKKKLLVWPLKCKAPDQKCVMVG